MRCRIAPVCLKSLDNKGVFSPQLPTTDQLWMEAVDKLVDGTWHWNVEAEHMLSRRAVWKNALFTSLAADSRDSGKCRRGELLL